MLEQYKGNALPIVAKFTCSPQTAFPFVVILTGFSIVGQALAKPPQNFPGRKI